MRIGDKKKPFYRVVVVDERNKRTGKYIENVGTYNPLTEPKEIKLNKERIEYWIKNGAQKSTGFLRILGEAPKKLIRPSKKEQKNPSKPELITETKAETPAAEQQPSTETQGVAEETTNETPITEEVKA